MFPAFWQPTASLQNLHKRSEILWVIRQFFREAGLAEVHTPILSADTVIDRHIEPIMLPGSQLALPELHRNFYLQTSPEFAMKRLLAGGMQAIYQITPVFRAGERGVFHNPEFTMLEWYRVGDDLQAGVRFLGDLVSAVFDPQMIEIRTYQQVFLEHAGIDPLACRLPDLSRAAQRHGLSVDSNWSEEGDDWLDLLFSEVVQPRLGTAQPVIVTHYPASQSALARVSATDQRVAERYELFINGIELANGYHELLDAEELVARNIKVLAQRAADGKDALPSDSKLLAAMRAGLPDCSGCALGLDRLVMLATAAQSIDQVLAFPIERA